MEPENDQPEVESTAEEVAQAELVPEAQLADEANGVPGPQMLPTDPPVVYSPAILTSEQTGTPARSSRDTPLNLKNIKAKGGATGAVVLGLFSVFGSFLTSWSAINALIGFCMGMWGLSSPKRRLALIGVALCAIGALLSMVDVSQIWSSGSSPSEF